MTVLMKHPRRDAMEQAYRMAVRSKENPFAYHQMEVAGIVNTLPHTPDMLLAAILHDVRADQQGGIKDVFGPDVAEFVSWFDGIVGPHEWHLRSVDRPFNLNQYASAPEIIQTMMLADMQSHLVMLDEIKDQEVVEAFLGESLQLIEALRFGDSVLWRKTGRLLQNIVDYRHLSSSVAREQRIAGVVNELTY